MRSKYVKEANILSHFEIYKKTFILTMKIKMAFAMSKSKQHILN